MSVQNRVKVMPTDKSKPMLAIPLCGVNARLVKLTKVVNELKNTPFAVLV